MKLKKIFILLLFIACSKTQTEESQLNKKTVEIQIKGSDTIVNLLQAWAEEFCKNYPDVSIGVTGGGSGTGFAALFNRICDIAMSSREIEEQELILAKEKNIKPVEYKIGLDGLIVIVNPKNPISTLTMDQLRDIFMGKIKNWKELGGVNKKIVILSREVNSGTHVFFKEHVLRKGNKKGKEEFAPEALLMPSSQSIVNEIMQNPYAIGYVGMGYISSNIKVLSIARTSKDKPVFPSIETVLDNSYPISRPLYLYTDGEPNGIVKDFISYALSPEGQKIVAKLDFVPIRKF